MNWINQFSLEIRTAVVFVSGVLVATQLNRAIYAWAMYSRPISPWARADFGAAPRSLFDYLPIVGWIGLRREEAIFGKGHWLRPLLIELLWPCALAALYWYTMEQRLLPPVNRLPAADPTLYLQFLSNAILFSLMLIATFIDFDEQTIPDEVTVVGALVGLVFAAAAPRSMLLMTDLNALAAIQLVPVNVVSPRIWPGSLDGVWGVLLAMLCFLAWVVSVLPLHLLGWSLRRWSVSKSLGVFWAASLRHPMSKFTQIVSVPFLMGIAAVWFFLAKTEHWQQLFSSLVGMVFGGGLIWGVRIVGKWGLKVEAMGFGDVTLMAMIGAFLGWQAVLITFFLAPVAALLIAAPQYFLTGRNDIAFGPYLCLAAVGVVVLWPFWWEDRNIRDLFNLGWTIVWIVVGCVALMGLMLRGLRFYRELVGDDDRAVEG